MLQHQHNVLPHRSRHTDFRSSQPAKQPPATLSTKEQNLHVRFCIQLLHCIQYCCSDIVQFLYLLVIQQYSRPFFYTCSAVIMAESLREFTRSLHMMNTVPCGCWPLDQANQLEPQAPNSWPVKCICHLLRLDLKADTYFTTSWRVEGWVVLGVLLHTKMFTCLQKVIHQSTKLPQIRLINCLLVRC